MAGQIMYGFRWHFTGCHAPIVGFMVRNRLGEDISGFNTSVEGLELPPASAGQRLTVDFQLKLPLLVPGNYHVLAGSR